MTRYSAAAGNDRLAGGLDNDTLIGGGGADTLDGGEGVDTADYSASTEAVQVYLDGTAGTGGHAAGDTLSNIENLIGSSYGDTLTGDDADNVIESGGMTFSLAAAARYAVRRHRK